MCGIIGWAGTPDPETARKMRDSMTYRGPDDSGEWWDKGAGIWLGHRRLSVIDLSIEGHQPMKSSSGRFVVTYNGEIYNHPDLRRELGSLGFQFRGTSDTEVLLAAVEAWGVEEAVRRFNGMFSFGLYDRKEKVVWLVRDRMGIKPLYYSSQGINLVFASEIRPFKKIPWIEGSLDVKSLVDYFRYLCVPAPGSIIQNIQKVKPGTMIRWREGAVQEIRYWDLKDLIRKGEENPFVRSIDEATEELDALIRDAVRIRMISDVPLGGFLSGGIDSSAVVAMMQANATRPVKTFTIGFEEPSHDETPFAALVADHLKTEHHMTILKAKEVMDLIPEVSGFYDEPFADGSSIPTFLLSRFSRNEVTVALSGDGGDEIFGGYPRYFWAERIQRFQRVLTSTGSRVAGGILSSIPASLWDGPVSFLSRGRYSGAEGLSNRVRRFGGYLKSSPDTVYQDMVSAWTDPSKVLGGKLDVDGRFPLQDYSRLTWSDRMMATDQENHLVDDILTKVDRASMAVSLEVRVPLLDHRIVEWSWRIPRAFKFVSGGDQGKIILKKVLARYVPEHFFGRPKMGFGMPMGRWLREELRPWAEELLTEGRLKEAGLNSQAVRKVWVEHLKGEKHLPRLWTVLMFLQWKEIWTRE